MSARVHPAPESTRFRKLVEIVAEKSIATACAVDGCSTAEVSLSVQGCNCSSGSWWPFCDLKRQEEVYLKICYLGPQNKSQTITHRNVCLMGK